MASFKVRYFILVILLTQCRFQASLNLSKVFEIEEVRNSRRVCWRKLLLNTPYAGYFKVLAFLHIEALTCYSSVKRCQKFIKYAIFFFLVVQFKMLLSILSDLLAKTKYALTGIRKIFPENSPNDGVPALVTLFRLSLESSRHLCTEFPLVFSTLHQAHAFASNLPIEPLGDILASYLKVHQI